MLFGQIGSVSAKVVLFVQNFFYLGKGDSIPAKVVLFGKMAVFGQIGSIFEKCFYLGKGGSI